MFRRTAIQSSYFWSRDHPSYLKFATPSTRTSPSLPNNLNSISPHFSYISTSIHPIWISVAFSHLDVCLCFISCTAVVCIPQWSHCGSGSGPSSIISAFDFQCLYMKCYLSIPWLFALASHPSTRHSTYFITLRKETKYVSGPPPPTYTPWVCVRTIQCAISMWWLSDGADIASPYSLQLTLVFLWSQNVAPSPITLFLYASVPCCPWIKPGVHTIALVLPSFLSVLTSQASLPPPSVLSGPRWVCDPLCSHFPHRRQCCVHLTPT